MTEQKTQNQKTKHRFLFQVHTEWIKIDLVTYKCILLHTESSAKGYTWDFDMLEYLELVWENVGFSPSLPESWGNIK